MVESLGNLDFARLEDNVLILSGWAAARGRGPVQGFKVTLRGRELPLVNARLGLASPDVMVARPELDNVASCRFDLQCGLSAEERKIVETSAITLTPLFRDGPGKVEVHLMVPAIPEPSAEDITTIGGGFLGVSKDFLRFFVELADLKPDESVLDVGCGVGRMAYMLAHYMRPEGRYEGFDIIGRLIDWANAEIGSRHPNFRFQKADIYNKHYNPKGAYLASEYRFPFEDESFDFIFLTSVFTHMFGRDVRHYLNEFNRVLRPGGRCLTTCFLLNDESKALIREKRTTQNLAYPIDDCFTSNPKDPEAALGYEEPLMLQWIQERGFEIEQKRPGHWCQRPEFLSYQDILVYRKVASVRVEEPAPVSKGMLHQPNLFRRALRGARALVRS